MSTPVRPTLAARARALSGVALLGVGAAVVLALHVLAPEVDPVRRTLPET